MRKPILVATGNPETSATIERILVRTYRIDTADTMIRCLELFRKRRYEFTFLDIGLLCPEKAAGISSDPLSERIDAFHRVYPSATLIVMTPQNAMRDAVEAVKAGATNYVTLPIETSEIKLVIDQIMASQLKTSELDYLRDHLWSAESPDTPRTRSQRMREVFEKVRSVAQTRTTVLLQGETGTGKGVVAKLIHQNSNRRYQQFIATHCGAIPETLLESELFGHEKGAFTGAEKRKLGKFEIAHGGTLFLDEIGTISPAAQIKLLQVLQERTFQRVGGETAIECDARVIAATNVDLRTMMEAGLFRKDLFYRLNVFPIEIPCLQERPEDIPMFASFFLQRFNLQNRKKIRDIHPEVLKMLAAYDWPGNIRELENLIERACILETTGTLRPSSFPGELFAKELSVSRVSLDHSQTLAQVRSMVVQDIEKNYLETLLKSHQGKIQKTAQHAGIGTRQLRNLMKKYGLTKKDFK